MVEKFWRHLEKLRDIFKKTCTQLWDNLIFFSRDGRFTQRGPALYEKNLESEYLGGGERKETLKKYDNTIFVTFGGGRPRNEEYVVPEFPVM